MKFLYAIFLLFIASSAHALDPINVGVGKHILPNGKFSDNEWEDATKTPVSDNLNLYFKQDNTYLYFAIKFLDTMHTGVDLYLAESSEKGKMLHISSALGEKEFMDGVWSDYTWGENLLWVGNSIGMVWDGEKNVTLPLDGFEFQIHKSMFPASRWYFMIHLKRPKLLIPEDADNTDIEKWQIIEFN
ncbi:hypothetical protein AMJ86_08805 [bacterium SM23_57]|nr:MAG: hypothetical protein AMJ86_08805 [bacterium SM23_57]